MKAYARVATSRSESSRLIHDHVDMARRIALRVARRLPDWIGADDVVAAAMVGLTEAAERYDSTRGEPFAAFAEKRIRGAVLDELRRGDLMPRRVRATARKVGQTAARLEGKLGRPAEDEEMAAELGVSVEEYRDELAGLSHVAVIDLERAGASNLADQGANSPSAQAERDELIGRVRDGLDRIPERDARILSLYYLEDLSYAEIGEVLGVTESRVCQLHARAIVRLRAELTEVEAP
jgi:RNA polymerase sigma factor for flagellar operon FliA